MIPEIYPHDHQHWAEKRSDRPSVLLRAVPSSQPPHILITVIIITVTVLQPAELYFPSFSMSIPPSVAASASHLRLPSSSSSSSSDSVLAACSPCLCPVARPVARLRSPVTVSCLGREAHHPGQAYADGETASQEIPHPKTNRDAPRNQDNDLMCRNHPGAIITKYQNATELWNYIKTFNSHNHKQVLSIYLV